MLKIINFKLTILLNLVIPTQDFIKSFSSEIFSQIWNGANDESWAYENQEITCNYQSVMRTDKYDNWIYYSSHKSEARSRLACINQASIHVLLVLKSITIFLLNTLFSSTFRSYFEI